MTINYQYKDGKHPILITEDFYWKDSVLYEDKESIIWDAFNLKAAMDVVFSLFELAGILDDISDFTINMYMQDADHDDFEIQFEFSFRTPTTILEDILKKFGFREDNANDIIEDITEEECSVTTGHRAIIPNNKIWDYIEKDC